MTQPINCANFEERINQRLDARLRLAGDIELEMHAKTCEQCRVLMADYGELEHSLGAFIREKSDSFQRSGRCSWAIERPIAAQRAIFSIAAVLLLGMCLAFGFNLDRGTKPPVIAANSTATIPSNLAVLNASPEPSNESVIQDERETPQLVANKHTLVNWNQISEQLQPLNSYYQFSAELPGVRPIQFSLGITLDWFQQTFFGSSQHQMSDPGFGGIIGDQNCHTA